MIVGSYYYGKNVKRCVGRLDGYADEKQKENGKEREFKRNIKDGRVQRIGSWIDAFVLGDVYILGFGMDFSEADLWWLIEYKTNHKDICGKTFFYNPRKNNQNNCIINHTKECKMKVDFVDSESSLQMLLSIYDVKIKDLNTKITCNDDYKSFYIKAISDIKKNIKKS